MNPLSLPWSVGQRYGLLKTEIVDASGRAIAVAWTHEQSSGEREPTPTEYGAEVLSLIVRAVNAHDELVAALRPFASLLRHFDGRASRPKKGPIHSWASGDVDGGEPEALTVEMLRTAAAVLAKATGEGA